MINNDWFLEFDVRQQMINHSCQIYKDISWPVDGVFHDGFCYKWESGLMDIKSNID